MHYKFYNSNFRQMEFLKNVRKSMITDYKNTLKLCDRLRNEIKDLNKCQDNAISYIEYIARLQLESGFDMYANEKSRVILDSTKTVDDFGIKEFLKSSTQADTYGFGSRSTDTDLSDYIKESILKINSKETFFEFCEEYVVSLINDYKLFCEDEKNNYNDDTGMMYTLLDEEDCRYLRYIIDLKYEAYDYVFEDTLTLITNESEEFKTDASLSSFDGADDNHKKKGDSLV